MARKSPWQEFADNFDSVYGTFQKVGKNIETKRLMDDDKFTAEGGLGYDTEAGKAMEGNALQKARYKALGDIYTKYGDADKGLAVQQQLANLEQSEQTNKLGRETLDEQIKRNGLLKTQIDQAKLDQIKAGTELTEAKSNKITELLGSDLEFAKQTARSAGYTADLNGVNAYLAKETQGETLDAQLSDLKLKMKLNKGLIAAADSETYEPSLIAGQKQIIDSAGLVANQRELSDGTLGTDIKSAKLANQVSIAESDTFLAFKDLDQELFGEALKNSILKAKADGNTAQLAEIETAAFLKFTTDSQAGLYKDNDEAASNAFINIVKQFDPGRAAKLAESYTATQVGQIANNGMQVQNEVASFLQNQDFEGLAKYFDEKNGDDIGIKITRTEAGGVKIVETKDGKDVNTILDAADQATALENMQALSSFGNTASYAELLFQREKGIAEKDKTIAEIDSIETSTAYQQILNDGALTAEKLKNSNTEERTKLATAQAQKLEQEFKQEVGLDWTVMQAQKSYNAWVTSEDYAYVQETLEGEVNNKKEKIPMFRIYKNEVMLGLGLLKPAPAGISDEDWVKLTDQDRARIIDAGK
jgi:hypothetical protein